MQYPEKSTQSFAVTFTFIIMHVP